VGSAGAKEGDVLGIPLGMLAANGVEWLVHKHVLHGLGKKRESFWAFHWHEHHRASRQNGHLDPHYSRSVFGWHAQGKEAAALVAGGALLLPVLPIAPLFTLTMWGCGVNYWRVHRRAHQDPEWAKEHLPWHYDHHMGPQQDANWCVTKPWFDHIMGTRVPYLGTARERADAARRADRARATAEPAPRAA
jgi:sterol desaturase/sphingolipid hydroxylase (fatty acid hydroxylase superfamily)